MKIELEVPTTGSPLFFKVYSDANQWTVARRGDPEKRPDHLKMKGPLKETWQIISYHGSLSAAFKSLYAYGLRVLPGDLQEVMASLESMRDQIVEAAAIVEEMRDAPSVG